MNEECSYVVTANITNPYKVAMKIVSGEIPQLNNKMLRPNSTIQFDMEIPKGFVDYCKEFMGPKQTPCVMIGWIVDEAEDLLY